MHSKPACHAFHDKRHVTTVNAFYFILDLLAS
jgi:hypothetical protein